MISQKYFQQFHYINGRTILVNIECFYNIQNTIHQTYYNIKLLYLIIVFTDYSQFSP